MKNSSKKSPSSARQNTNSSNMFSDRWMVTIHGARPENCPILNLLKSQFQKDEYTLAAVAYETGQHGIHPHWQIYFQTAKKCRMKQRFTNLLGEDVGFHIELAKSTRNKCLVYIYAVEKQHEIGWVHYAKGHVPPASYRPYKTQNLLWLRDNMKPWQRWITNKVTQRADYRDILWVLDPGGNAGKTYLAKYLHYFHGAIITGGSSSDMKHAIARWRQITGHYPVTIIIDSARSDTIRKDSYKAIEQLKNALFFSGKYESGMVASCTPPNIVVFSNKPPKLKAFSRDRWVVRTIDPETQQLVPWVPDVDTSK